MDTSCWNGKEIVLLDTHTTQHLVIFGLNYCPMMMWGLTNITSFCIMGY